MAHEIMESIKGMGAGRHDLDDHALSFEELFKKKDDIYFFRVRLNHGIIDVI